MQSTDKTAEITTSLIEVQRELENLERDEEVTVKTNSGKEFSYRYTTLGNLIEQIKPKLNKFDIVLLQGPNDDGRLVTRLQHVSGQWIQTTTPIVVSESDPQEFGASMTYARRYGLAAILGLASEHDDDAVRSSSKGRSSGGQQRGKNKNGSSGASEGSGLPDDPGSSTKKQENAIYAISENRIYEHGDRKLAGKDELVEFIKRRQNVDAIADLSMKSASSAIDWLKGLEEIPEDEVLAGVDEEMDDDIPF